MLTNDIALPMIPRLQKRKLAVSRVMIVLVLTVAGLLACGPLGDTILKFTFMSMGLRGAVVFLPLSCALWLPNRIPPRYTLAAVITGPQMVLLFGLWKVLPFDSLFAGVGVSAVIMAIGLMKRKQ